VTNTKSYFKLPTYKDPLFDMSQDVEKSKNVSNRKKSDFLKEEDEDLLQASPIANRT